MSWDDDEDMKDSYLAFEQDWLRAMCSKHLVAECGRQHAHAVARERLARIYRWAMPVAFAALAGWNLGMFVNEMRPVWMVIKALAVVFYLGLGAWTRVLWSKAQRHWTWCAEWWLEVRHNVLEP